ncbi:BRCA1-associated RING domain protein 1 [Dioscorea alata]|uniref:BRCA1-associated RING domain protein 1 n=1 Tax=Dioscorea alata TaxID=55571 RepID=A0ACB7WRU2_DIOAL|nr:BRCA1-associated RING domain protein 1 [Dioscorea alata]
MADYHSLRRFLNPLLLNLQKMELELKCPICLNLLSVPQLLSCDHIVCSHCIKKPTNTGTCCPVCNTTLLCEGIRPSIHMETMVTIYKSMSTAFGVNLLQRGSQVNVSELKTPSNESPGSANNRADRLMEKSVPKLALQSCTHLSGNKINMKEGDNDEQAIHGREDYMNNRAELAFANKEGPYSPPSFGDLKDSDHESNDQGSDRAVPEKRLIRKDLNVVGANESEQDEFRESKKQKLDKELGRGDDIAGINVKAMPALIAGSEHEHESLPRSQPLSDSTFVATEASVECVFCHSFRVTEASGEMLHYLNGTPVDENHPSPDVLHVHQQCIEWAPQIYFAGENAMNVEAELSRAAKIKCSSCGMKGAALGCYVRSCRKSFHVPCAFEILGCRRDYENFLLLCPAHASHRLPCDRSKAKKKTQEKHPSMESDSCKASDNLTSLTKLGGNEFWMASTFVSSQWVLSGSALSEDEKVLLNEFARLTGATIAKAWKPKITHVIASTNEHGACSRTLKVLMAILEGKWVLRTDWIKACLEAGSPVEEEPYEITHDVNGSFDGPRIGRTRAMTKAPKLFFGLSFYLTGYYMPYYKGYLEDLILAAGGVILQKIDAQPIQSSTVNGTSTKLFVVYSVEPPQGCNTDQMISYVLKKRTEDAEALAAEIGAHAVSHTWLLDSIAACNLQLN